MANKRSGGENGTRATTRRPLKTSVTKQGDRALQARAKRTLTGPSHRVRIIGGRWKRTPLPVLAIDGLRPTPDRVRETLFNWIEHLIPGLADAHGVDLFAGTGALGFELASRGARRVVLIETSRPLIEQLTETKRKLSANQIEIVAGDALATVVHWAEASFDVVFIDPPFDSQLLPAALASAARLITPTGLIYVESGAPLPASVLAANQLQVARSGRAGRVHFHLLRSQSA